MGSFPENNCRICGKTFCCQDCREKHEENLHYVNPKCDICIYGKCYISDVSPGALKHIRDNHWPLHCAKCNIVFSSIDQLIQHDKCRITEVKMMPSNPLTPVTPINEGALVLTRLTNPRVQTLGLTITMGITSTPLNRENNNINTPNELKSIFKSSLKSASLNESKKCERRVTFSDTPMGVTATPSAVLPANEPEEESNETYESVREDAENEAGTAWESALMSLSQPQLFSEISASFCEDNESQVVVLSETSQVSPRASLWTSVSSILKSVVHNVSSIAQNTSSKRSLPDDSFEEPRYKRMKYGDVQCRRPIRELGTEVYARRPRYVDKATQTD